MDISQMKYFVYVCKYNSMSKAAQRLYISRQALSTAMKRLEAEVGAQMLERSAVGIRLTEAGKVFLPSAMRILEEYEKVMRSMKTAPKQTVHIAFCLFIREGLPDGCLEDFESAHPGIQLDVTTMITEDCCAAVERGDADIAVTMRPEHTDMLNIHQLGHGDTMVLFDDRLALADMDTIPVSAIADRTVFFPARCRSILVQAQAAWEKAGYRLKYRHDAPDYLQLFRHCQQEGGVILTGKKNSEEYWKTVSHVACRPLESKDIDHGECLISAKNRARSAAAQSLWDYLVDVYETKHGENGAALAQTDDL